MGRRWTYAHKRTNGGNFSPYDLVVLMDGKPIGWARFVSWAGGQRWHWRVDLTQQHGSADSRDEALKELRASMLEWLGPDQ